MPLDPDILAIFLEEARGYLQLLEDTTATGERRRRAAHGLKGAAALLELSKLSGCGRRMEQILARGPELELWDEILLARVLLSELDPAQEPAATPDEPAASAEPPHSGAAPAQEAMGEKTGVVAGDRADADPRPSPTGHRATPVELDEEWDPETARLLRGLFSEEARDHLEVINAALMNLEATPEQRPRELLDELLRKAHTLKGSAATVGLGLFSQAAHLLEERLVAVKELHQAPDSMDIDRLLRATDVLDEMLEAPAEQLGPLLERLRQGLVAPLAEAGPHGAAPPEDGPPLHPEAVPGSPYLAGGSPGVAAERRQDERRVSQERRAEVMPTMRVDVGRLDQLMNTTSELVIDRTRIERRVEELRDLARELSVVRRDFHGVLAEVVGLMSEDDQDQTAALESAIAASASNLDRVITSLNDDSETLRRTTRDLQEHLTQVRMVPIRWLHARLQRPIREMARSQGKEVELLIHDEATEMDRSVVTQITDSLVQLVRNAVAHGIETPSQRKLLGKAPRGLIEITARHQGDVVFVELKDDGAGIQPQQLRRLLARRGEMDQRALDALGDDELLDLIFTNGFTTRAGADELSGRGVGLDIVRQNISTLGGDIRVSSRPGHGTRFAIQMPMTTAMAQALLFKAGDQVYAIPVVHVSETLFVEPDDLQEGDLCRLRTRDGWIPLLYLHRVLGIPSPLPLRRLHDPEISHARQPVIVIRLGDSRFGITCTRVVGPREIVLKGLGTLLAPHPMLAAATISGSNKVQFVLDVAFLARAATLGVIADEQGSAADGAVHWPPARKLVLLVDDSRSVREAVANILRRAGLAVETAPDGDAAWSKLQVRRYDLLLTDLEMPRMHGLELISRCRQAPSLAILPIVVLSSKNTQANRAAALRKGADVFLSKPINRRGLVQELRRYLVD